MSYTEMSPNQLSQAVVFDALQKEFCPPLDSSLVAALLADVDFTEEVENGNREQDVENLCQMLKELSAQAEVDVISHIADDASSLVPDEDLAPKPLHVAGLEPTKKRRKGRKGVPKGSSDPSSASSTTTSLASDSFAESKSASSSATSHTTTSASEISSESDLQEPESFASPLGFLQAALPHIATAKLRGAYEKHQKEHGMDLGQTEGQEAGQLDMWDLITSILTSESAREMEERGFEDESESFIGSYLQHEDEDARLAQQLAQDEEAEEVRLAQLVEEDEKLAKVLAEEGDVPDGVIAKEKEWVKIGGKKSKKKAEKGIAAKKVVKIRLNDMRQQKVTSNGPTSPINDTYIPSSEKSTQVLSLSTHLASLFPTYGEGFFKSYLGSQKYMDLYEACWAALVKVSDDGGKEEPPNVEAPISDPDPPPFKTRTRMRSATDGHRSRPVSRLKPPGTETEVEADGSEEGSAADSQSAEGDGEETALLFNLLDLFLPLYGLDPGASYTPTSQYNQPEFPYDQRDQEQSETRTLLVSEIQLAISACRGKEETALDVVRLLRDLDEERRERFPELVEDFFMGGLSGGATLRGARGVPSAVSTNSVRRHGLSYAELVSGAISKGSGPSRMGTGTFVDAGSSSGQGPSGSGPTMSSISVNMGPPPTAALEAGDATKGRRGKNKPSPYQWQAVPSKRAPEKRAYAILPHLPTYTRDVNGILRRRKPGALAGDDPNSASFGAWTRGMSDQGNLQGASLSYLSEAEAAEKDYRRKIGENVRRRDELLREAARMWSRGQVGGFGGNGGEKIGGGSSRGGGKGKGSTNVGGEVAFYFAERAREFQEMARKECLNAARAMVYRKRLASNDMGSLDLHGTTVAEATVIVQEVLAAQPATQARPLKIITGRGSHSANQTSVLKPALKKRLGQEGWVVGTWDAGLVVRGRR